MSNESSPPASTPPDQGHDPGRPRSLADPRPLVERQAERPRLVLITGAGRSGTSTIAGIFSRLGAHIPEPMLAANLSNPRGFYESSWPVGFHHRLFKRANIEQTDGRPVAGQLVRAAIDHRARDDLHQWLGEQFDSSDLVVVKDPRAAWVPRLWSDTATELGAELSYVTMVRHPSEVISSRTTYYGANRPSMGPREFAVWTLCGWINQNLTLERETRHASRVFLPYTELLADWRGATTRLLADLHLPGALLTPAAEIMIDSFVEPRLRRHGVDWGELALPQTLVGIAEDAWDTLHQLGGQYDDCTPALSVLDDIGDRYSALYADAEAIAHDHASARARQALRHGRREGRRKAEQARAAENRARAILGARLRRVLAGIGRRLKRVARPGLGRKP